MGTIIPFPSDVADKVRGVTAAARPVTERVTSVTAARTLYNDASTNYQHEALRRARIKGMIDGERPYDQAELDSLGLGYKTNVNFLELRAAMDAKAAARHELFHEVPTLIETVPVVPDKERQLFTMGRIISEEFSTLMQDWSGFFVNMDKAGRESDAYGIGFQAWFNEFDYRSKAVQVLVNPRASLDIEQLQIAFIRDEMLLSELTDKVRDSSTEQLAKESGWNITKLKDTLVSQFGPGAASNNNSTAEDQNSKSPWEAVQERIRNNDVLVQTNEFSGLRVVHMLVRELSGKVSHYIFTDDPVSDTSGSTEDAFLFKATERFDKMSRVLWWLPHNYGDGTIRSVRGTASYLEPHCDLSNRFLGQIFDAAFMSASLVLQPKSAIDMSNLQLVRMGVFTLIPPELNAVTSGFNPSFQHLISVRGLSNDVMQNNSGTSKRYSEVAGEQQAEKTARQVVEEVAKEARVEKSTITHEYNMLDMYYREVFRRVTNKDYVDSEADHPGKQDAIALRDRCVKRGVPVDIFYGASETFSVHATRAIGMGSWGVKMDVTNQLIGMRSLFDEAGKVEAVREALAVRVGYRNVDRFRPAMTRDQTASEARSFAVLENNDMAEGSQVLVGEDQLHKVHVEEHFAWAQDVMDKASGGQMDPRQAYAAMGSFVSHVTRHLELLSIDKAYAEFIAEAKPLLERAIDVTKLLEKRVKQMVAEEQKKAEEQQRIMQEAQQKAQAAEAQARQAEVTARYELERQKQESLNQARAEKTAAQLDIHRRKAEAEITLKSEKQAAELAMEQTGGR